MSSIHSNDALRVVIIGYGHGGEVFHAPLVASTPGMRVSAIVTSNPERRRHAQQAFPQAELLASAEEIWKDPRRYDLVVVTTPNRFHVSLGIAALQAGLPVVVDKPFAASVADAERLIAVSEETGKLLSVFHNARWDSVFMTARRIVEAQLLGSVARLESRYERYRPVPRANAWRELADFADAGGLLYDLGSHLIDQALLLFGFPRRVYAEMPRRRPGVEVDDDTFVSLEFASGVHAHLWMSSVVRVPASRLRITGLLGTYDKWGVDPQEEMLRAGIRPGDERWGMEPRERWGHISTEVSGLHFDGAIEPVRGCSERYYALMRDAILTGSQLPVEPREALATLQVIEAALRSAQEHTVVELANLA
ncbi:oxidoreductase [Ktedonosporobacter rubrisoli]|uniref:Oxidoreductase n=1 Tax=Ktedonosporobacter rubrisoli TaxID=2509675 RepID=A0A4P6JT70_KTERU|nr:Gfo/Idh/MocA family oxidoreductase [Ktedonosporobacter rubrisoli]QBD78624.1 oxidoreductase [Ktedonosporobacter rubrisoli]